MDCNSRILELLNEKAVVKQEVARSGEEQFVALKAIVKDIADTLESEICKLHDSVHLKFEDKNEYEFALYFGGDVLLFSRHSNVFTFEANHQIWKMGYVRENKSRAYFSMINIYNFMADSFRFRRGGDKGVLLGRVFINREGHFFVEGKRQLGFLFNDLAHQTCNQESLQKIVEAALIYALEYDLTAPQYREVLTVSVKQVLDQSMHLEQVTSKKVGLGYYSRMKKN